MDAGRRNRVRTVVTAAAGALLVAAFVAYGPAVPASAPTPAVRVAAGDPKPPADWRRRGTFLTSSQVYPSVVRLLGLGGSPFCSGSVVHSPGGDLVLTAAHCVYADGSYMPGATVVPGLTGSSHPYGSWRVDRVWIDPRYTGRDHDERYDYALLRVVRGGGPSIESVTGANVLSVDQPFHLTGVTTTGYPEAGNPDGRQLTCTMETYRSPAHPRYREMHCGRYTAGVSGAPWVLLRGGARTGAVIGVIGGFNGGGPADGSPHEDAISYSPYFDASTVTLLHRAESGAGGHAVGR